MSAANPHQKQAGPTLEQIRQKIVELGYNRVAEIFERILADATLNEVLTEVARSSSPPVRLLNLHDKGHALSVCNYALQLWGLLVESGLVKPSMDKESALLVTLTASYTHDIGRWAKSEHPTIGLIKVDAYLKPILLDYYGRRVVDGSLLINNSKWIEKHDDLECQVEYVEEGIVKIADKLHCAKDRAFKTKDGARFRHSEVLLGDDQPWEYYGCLAVDNVEVTHEKQRPVAIVVSVNSLAASPQIKTILSAVKCTEKIGVAKFIEVYLKQRAKPVDLIWSTAEFDEKATIIYHAKVDKLLRKIDVKNKEGDIDLRTDYVIRNLSADRPIDSFHCLLETTSQNTWKDCDVHAYDSNSGEELKCESIDVLNPYKKTFRIRFDRIEPQGTYSLYYTAKLGTVYPWDDPTHSWSEIILREIDKIDVIIVLPREIQITPPHACKSDGLMKDQIDDNLKTIPPEEASEGRWTLELQVSGPERGLRYMIEWMYKRENTAI